LGFAAAIVDETARAACVHTGTDVNIEDFVREAR